MPRAIWTGTLLLLCLLAPGAAEDLWFGTARFLSVPTTEIPDGGHFSFFGRAAWTGDRLQERRHTGLSGDVGLTGRLIVRADWSRSGEGEERLLGALGARVVPERVRWPAVAVHLVGVGNGQTPTGWLVLSKEWNLPRLGFFRIHGGVGLSLESEAPKAFGYGGVEKRLSVGSEQLRLLLVGTESSVQIGLLLQMRRGGALGVGYDVRTRTLQAALGYDPAGWEERLSAVERLAKQAVQIATEGAGRTTP